MTSTRSSASGPSELAAAWPRRLLPELSLLVLDRVGSTQDLARKLLDRHLAEGEDPLPFALVAFAQTDGRGRRGRRWESAPGLGVWASLTLPSDADRLATVPMRCAVALAGEVSRHVEGVRLKWPNDLVIGRAKLGGLLVDAVSAPDGGSWAIVGFGINHGHGEDELPVEGAISLALAAAGPRKVPPLSRFATDCVAAVWEELRSAESDWLERYRALSAHAPGDILVAELETERIEGRVAGFDESGFLRLETAEGERRIRSGEVFSW